MNKLVSHFNLIILYLEGKVDIYNGEYNDTIGMKGLFGSWDITNLSVAFNTEHAMEIVNFNPYFQSVCNEKKKKSMSAEEISAIEDRIYMRCCR